MSYMPVYIGIRLYSLLYACIDFYRPYSVLYACIDWYGAI